MKILAQGLRRSGTTILFDIFEEDRRLASFYEPLSAGKPTVGGGSQVKSIDYAQKLKEARIKFAKTKGLPYQDKQFNFGAPRDFKLESGTVELPNLIQEYLNFLINYKEDTFLKFTRATFFIKNLYDLSPDALFIHVIKNPRRFVESHLRGSFNDPDVFFGKKSGFNNWSQESIINHYLKNNDSSYLDRKAHFKLLYLWKIFNQKIEKDGLKYFKHKYYKLYNEDLVYSPRPILKNLYNLAGLESSENVIAWAEKNLKRPKEIIFKNDERWFKALDELNIIGDI